MAKHCIALIIGLLISMPSWAASKQQVKVITPTPLTTPQTLKLIGSIESVDNAMLAPLQAGVVKTILVEQGDVVDKGQALLTLDQTLSQLELNQQKANVTAAKASLKEAQRLYQELLSLSKKQFVAETEKSKRSTAVALAKSDLAKAEATLAFQREVLNRHTLVAPFAGVIAQRNVDLGEWVTQQTQAFNLISLNKLRASLTIPQEYHQQLLSAEKIEVNITPDAQFTQTLSTKVTKLVAAVDPQSRTLTALIDLPRSGQLISGMSVTAELILPNSNQDIFWLPKSALKQHPDGGRSVFTVEGGTAKRYQVSTIKQRADMIAVTGIPANTSVISGGVEYLRNGMSVSVSNTQGQ